MDSDKDVKGLFQQFGQLVTLPENLPREGASEAEKVEGEKTRI